MSQHCEICGIQEARYVCRQCGRRVCGRDFRSELWLCTNCAPITGRELPRLPTPLSFGLSWIFFLSFAMIVLGMILMMAASFTQLQGITSGGAIILIGPIPIILGSGPESVWLILLGLVITIVAVIAFLLTRRKIQSR